MAKELEGKELEKVAGGYSCEDCLPDDHGPFIPTELISNFKERSVYLVYYNDYDRYYWGIIKDVKEGGIYTIATVLVKEMSDAAWNSQHLIPLNTNCDFGLDKYLVYLKQ